MVESGQGPFDERRQKGVTFCRLVKWSKAAKALSTNAVKKA
jgi:hypothetical protein